MKRKCSLVYRVMAIFLLLMVTMTPSLALDDDEMEGYAADTLTLKVGYFGGPYYEKHVFTLEELWGMDVVYSDYTFIDQMPAVVINHVAGVRLADIVAGAGIDLNSVQTFYFWTRDKTSDYFTSYPKSELIDIPRYCYYSLPENFDTETGTATADATAIAERVDTVIALADDWNRVLAGASFGSDYLNLNTFTRFRLIFGQTDGQTRTAGRSAKWIHEIVVELGGAPTITMDSSALDLEVGSVWRTEARVNAADAAIAQQAEITYQSSDESVATVDEEGVVTVHQEGNATITASYGGATASVTVKGTGEGDVLPVQPPEGGGTTQEGPDGPEEPGDEPGEEETSSPEQVTPLEVAPTAGPTSILPEQVTSGDELGGVQNWRVYEMSETAVELPEVEEDIPYLHETGWAALGLFLLAALGRGLLYLKEIEEKPHVFSH